MKIDRFTAERIAEGMNNWTKGCSKVITAKEVMELTPIAKREPNGLIVYAYQVGDVTLLAWLGKNGDVMVRHVAW